LFVGQDDIAIGNTQEQKTTRRTRFEFATTKTTKLGNLIAPEGVLVGYISNIACTFKYEAVAKWVRTRGTYRDIRLQEERR
jgi:hypothetical protein